ncbi:hypothetical protein F5Y15DRAFT_291199 [Xylariaceae sp. FL0016]|nr:hypothetical protein F5Y15DRAFT_291199 [Xylariaceae sp. FL0016]
MAAVLRLLACTISGVSSIFVPTTGYRDPLLSIWWAFIIIFSYWGRGKREWAMEWNWNFQTLVSRVLRVSQAYHARLHSQTCVSHSFPTSFEPVIIIWSAFSHRIYSSLPLRTSSSWNTHQWRSNEDISKDEVEYFFVAL